MKLLKEGKEGHDDQSSHQELLNMLGGMKGQAKLDDTRQSRIKIYQQKYTEISQTKIYNTFILYMITIMTNKVTPPHNKY